MKQKIDDNWANANNMHLRQALMGTGNLVGRAIGTTVPATYMTASSLQA